MNKRIIPSDDPRWPGINRRAAVQMLGFRIDSVTRAMPKVTAAFANLSRQLDSMQHRMLVPEDVA